MNRVWVRLQGGPIIVFCLSLALAAVFGLLADQPVAEAQGGPEDHSGQFCAECHLDYAASWQRGAHSIAYTRDTFQAAWADFNNDPTCLECHTTGYNLHDNTYLIENVTCEACHGTTPADHPPADFVVNTAPSACRNCHTGTFAEWRRSAHAFTEEMGALGCATCHNPHGQNLRFDSVDALCLNCHQTVPNNYVHLTHNSVDFGDLEVNCASCHMYRAQGLGDGTRDDVVSHQIPNHTMQVETTPCTACHEALSQTGEFERLIDIDAAIAEERDSLRAQVTELQTALDTASVQKQETGINYIQLTQGLIVGLGLGLTAAWVLLRRDGSSSNTGKKS